MIEAAAKAAKFNKDDDMAVDIDQHLGEADGQGRIRLEGQDAPAAYQVRAVRNTSGAYKVRVSVMASRDWLLHNGFTKTANLIRENGEESPVAFDGSLDVGDNIAVRLTCEQDFSGSEDDFIRAYPEFTATLKPGDP
ncbi:hypothetical protein [Rhizobium sp. FKL33]|uniref:hypothetical protein n=1 Tax=Rhizobium sp. FKL33 TaxID=2562307 RepID=UPI0010BF8D0D|nr:hypothetical protein [Rhizobium sp. FKL33]